jgi:long-chain fatty acid transport protein
MPTVLHPIPLLLVCGGCLAFPVVHAAEGTRLIGTGPVQVGTAGAGVASPQNSSWLSLNPAGLVDISGRVDVSTDIINGRVEVTPRGNPAVANTADGTLDDSVIVFAPAATWVMSWDGQAVGLGFYTLSGLAMDLPGGRSAIGDAGGYDNHAEVRTTATSLAYARRITDGLSLALAANLIYSDIRSNSLTLQFQQTAGNDELDYALGGGFSLSLYQRWNEVSVGATYTSRQWLESWDKYADLYAGSPDQPPVLQVGLAWRPLPWLEPLLDYKWIDWDSVAVFGNDIEDKGLGWRDQHIVKLACNARLREDMMLRAGVSYGRSPIDESVAFANALSVLTTEWHATIGFGWQVDQTWEVQIAYLHGFANEVTDNGDNVGGLAAGTTIDLEVDSLIVGVGWRY